jgi:3-oxoacyl-[acyl-carrier-protein] synthase II
MQKVVVTGIGLLTSIGKKKREFWKNLADGVCGIDTITGFDTSDYSSRIGSQIKEFDPSGVISEKERKRFTLFVQYALVAAKDAIDDAGLDLDMEDRSRIGVLIGSGIGGLTILEREHKVLLKEGPVRISPYLIPMMIIDMAAGVVSIKFGLKGPNQAVATACATSTHAIGDAFRMIRAGYADVMVAGGAEASITPLGLAGFCAARALSTRNSEPEKASRPFDAERDGFVMGDGAGVLILEEECHAKKRGAKIYAEIKGYGESADAYHITAPDPSGDGAALCMKEALKDARLSPDDIDCINAHGTSTKLNDRVETVAIKKVFGERAKRIPITANKSMIGHLLGAAGAVEAIASVLTIENGVIPPTINQDFADPECDLDYVPNKAREFKVDTVLSNSFGFGGHNASLIFARYG